MQILILDKLTKGYGDHTVLEQVSFHLNQGERAALVGENGAGKSTLLKLAASWELPDEGEVRVGLSARVGYLPQTVEVRGGLSIGGYLDAALGEIRELQAEMDQLTAALGSGGQEPEQADVLLAAYGMAAERFEALGGYEADYRTAIALDGLGLGSMPRERGVDTLSGGEKRRLALAGLLASAPDCLLLDEPTNHLDEQAIRWLESYIAGYQGTILFASHDRLFMNRTVNRMIEIDEATRRCTFYTGNYDAYREQKRLERLRWEEEYEREQEEIRELRHQAKDKGYRVAYNRPATDRDKFITKFQGERVQRRISQNIRKAEKQLERILDNPVPRPPEPLSFRIRLDRGGADGAGGESSLHVSGLVCAVEEGRPLFAPLSFSLQGPQRLLIAGPNGTGKTTLLRVLTGEWEAMAGRVVLSSESRIGYLEQERQLSPEDCAKTVLELYREGRIGYLEDHTRELLDTGLFRPGELDRKAGVLSPGQLRKLSLARLIVDQPDILLLDEPTNHLSLELVEQLEQAIHRFPGPVLMVSHDRWLIGQFADHVLYLTPGNLRSSE
ncbi:ABC-F family ATP-binding cassette domain-containing protein [Paenibacillus filicis]|uniref:ABC-F family ATP-binding cassette domain-containing protein n=1 Tax=Paenibacillus filicis TaxID=669464 RepID=A0ABU9DQS4_9BACL